MLLQVLEATADVELGSTLDITAAGMFFGVQHVVWYRSQVTVIEVENDELGRQHQQPPKPGSQRTQRTPAGCSVSG